MPWPFRRRPRRRSRPDAPETPIVLVDDTVDPRVRIYHDPQGMQAEQYRSFRTNLRAMNPRDGATTLIFTSAMPEDGKSVSVANIGLALAELEHVKVCVVDADLRSPKQHKIFGLDADPGLSNVLVDRLPPHKALRAGPTSRLSVVTAGRGIANPVDVTGSDHLVNLVGYLKQRYNYVLIDTPPCLLFSDAPTMARVVDGTVIVVALEWTPKRDADRAVSRIEAAGGQVIGTFVTGTHTPDPNAVLPKDYVA